MQFQSCRKTYLVAFVMTTTVLAGSTASAKIGDWQVGWGEQVAQEITAELASLCPVTDPADEGAYEDCRVGVRNSEVLDDNLADYVIWGGGDIESRLNDRKLTQFGKSAWTSLYLPLFVFTGNSMTEVDEEAGLMRLRVEARFRNLLEPGQYPYPFWHAEGKWTAYQKANELVFTIDLRGARVIGVQRSPFGTENPDLDAEMSLARVEPPRDFNKDEWMWADDEGNLQPKVTVFDGMFDAANPHVAEVDSSYTAFAEHVRDQDCLSCHVPTNPEDMGNLILLQTPAHAAGEIDRIIRAVEDGAMPVESWAGPQGIPDKTVRDAFLQAARAFQSDLATAQDWEQQH